MESKAQLSSFADMMTLEPHGPDTFVGVGPQYPWGGLYGGQIVAQALRAAGLTVGSGFNPHSLHAYFIRSGDHTQPIRFEVDRIRNGRSFTTRRVVARQSMGAILNLAASFHVPEDTVDVAPITMPDDAGSPDGFTDGGWSHVFDRRQPGLSHGSPHVGRAMAWLRMSEAVPDDPLTRACALAYLSDDLPTEAAVANHPKRFDVDGENDFDRTFFSASLDHAMWFHRSGDPGEWQFHDARSRGLTDSRGLVSAEVFSADGTHVATVSQEVLLRVRTD